MKDPLAIELSKAGLHVMAARAEHGYYHDFRSPLATPKLQLAADLVEAGTPAAMAIRRRVLAGEFDDEDEAEDDRAQDLDDEAATL